MEFKTNNDKQRQSLVINYFGPRGGKCKLKIEGLPMDENIRKQLQDPDYWPEWKTVYLADLYQEQVAQKNEAKHHQYEVTDNVMATYMYKDASGQAHHIQNGEGRSKYSLSSTAQDFELDLENHEVLEMLLSELNPEQRERTILFHLYGYRYTDIAEMQGVSPTAVRNSINRGFAAIRKKYPDHVQKGDS
ncbi:MAG TPA: hypothetical protein GXX64_09810, partial [Bacteroidales bacterium]|nr:hypothetical protein [Bacteroidales bacterium]